MTVEQNISRLNYLLNLFRLSDSELLKIINQGVKRKLTKDDVFSKEIKVSNLKKVDRVFNKGLSFYIDPQDPPENKQASIFFRKRKFNSELNLKAKQIVNEFEELKLSISAIAKLSDIDLKRNIPVLSIRNSPKESAIKYRDILYPSFSVNQKHFLTSLINKLAEFNVFVFEFVETWNQLEKANIDGIYIEPNVIVIKRQEYSFRREIFTLAHELAHYLLNVEEVEKLDYDVLAKHNLGDIENWCNDFAFYFLIGKYESIFNKLSFADSSNDYHHATIKEISEKTHLSELALYTRLRFADKISYQSYIFIKTSIEEKIKEYFEEEKRKRDLEKQLDPDKQGGGAKIPIKSNLLISTIQTAFYDGVIGEYEVCKTLKISPNKIGNYIQ